MTSQSGHDVIRRSLNIAYATRQSIIFQTWGRKLLYLFPVWKYTNLCFVDFRQLQLKFTKICKNEKLHDVIKGS